MSANGATERVPVVERARRYVAKMPPAISGEGGHDRTFHVACVLVHGFALAENDALSLLREFNERCQPQWTEAELQHKVDDAEKAQHQHERGHLLAANDQKDLPQSMWTTERAVEAPKMDPFKAATVFLRGFTCGEAELMEASPLRLAPDAAEDGPMLVKALYAQGELVNYVTAHQVEAVGPAGKKAKPHGKGVTKESRSLAEQWRTKGLAQSNAGGWLRMNPVDGRGVADGNVTAFRFVLLECDKLPVQTQLALIAKLPLPIAAVLKSGGVSIHAWVRVDALDAEEYRRTATRLLQIMGRFGFDPSNRNPSRLSRLPGAQRVIGAAGDGRQRLLYLNPTPEQRSIL